jgi:OmpA-OmpF porin, OOP family
LGGMANQATTLSGADNLLGMINKGGHDGSIFDTLGNLLGDSAGTNDLLKNGGKAIGTFFGNNVSDIAHWVAAQTGIKSGSAWSLMNLAAPILMGAVSKNMDSSRSASSLVSLLGSQLPFLKKMIPSELLPVLGLSQLNLAAPSLQKEAPKPIKATPQPAKAIPQSITKTINEEEKTSALNKPLLKSLMPWLLLLGGALIGLLYLRSCKSQTGDTPTAATTTVADVPKTNTSAPTAAASDKVLKLTEGEIKVKTGSFLDLLYSKITDANADLSKSLTFDNVNFAKYKTDLTDSSKIQLDDLVKIMKAYPSVSIKINGYTDSRGDADENKTLSKGRAASVKSYLSSKGIADDRMVSEGLGQANPIADNETEAGRAKNRRIEAVVTKK